MRRPRRFPSPRTGVLLLVGAAVLAFYVWTVTSSLGGNVPDRPATSASLASADRPIDPSNLLADAFLHGRTNLDLPIPAGLRNAADPLNPASRGPLPSDYIDLSYHDGKLYSYWGPVPALTLFAPAHLLGLRYLSQALAVLLYCAAAFVLLALAIGVMVRRFVPRCPTWLLALGLVALGTGNLGPYLLRRPEVYEVSLAAAMCFSAAALLCFALFYVRARTTLWLLALGSLFAGLALGCRPPVGLVGLFGPAALIARRGGLRAAVDARALLAAIGPWAICLVVFAAYNQVRFGSPSDFGVDHQLETANVSGKGHVVPAYLPPGLWYYIVSPPRLRLLFPFFWLPPGPTAPVPTPASYLLPEPTGGLLPTLPIVVLPLVAWIAGWRPPRDLARPVWALAVLGVVLLVFTAAFTWTTTMRYETDFRQFLLPGALLAWAAVAGARRGRARRWLVAAGACLAAWGVLVSVMTSFVGEKNRLFTSHNGQFTALAHAFDFVPTVFAQVAGRPMVVAIDDTVQRPPWRYDRVSMDGLDLDLGTGPSFLRVVSPTAGIRTLHAVVTRAPWFPPGKRVLFGASSNGTGYYAPAAGKTDAIRLRLEAGMNVIRLEAAADWSRLAVPPGAYAVRLRHLEVR